MQKVNIEELRELIQKNQGYLFVRFTTSWCGICKVNFPILQKIEKKYFAQVKFLDIDADESKTWSEDGDAEFNVKLVPTYMLFKQNKKIWEKNNFVGEPVFEELFQKL